MSSIQRPPAKPWIESLIGKHPCTVYRPKPLNPFWQVMEYVICDNLSKQFEQHSLKVDLHVITSIIYYISRSKNLHSHILRKRELIENHTCFYGLNGSYYTVITCTCRDKGKSLSSRASATSTFSFSDGIFASSCKGAHSAAMASINMAKLSLCASSIISLTRYFSMPQVAT